MKSVKELYFHLNTAKEFKHRYPYFDMNDKKIHVLFLSACTNESGYYRMILPALELNRTNTHCAIIGHIHKWDFNKMFDDYDNPIDFKLVQWADYVVMPVLFSDVSYIIKGMRDINSDIEFVIDLDVNYHELPEYHPDFKKFKPELKDILMNNLMQVDLLTAPNNHILNFYHNLAQRKTEELSLYPERYTNLLSNFTFEESSQIKKNASETVRIGLILDGTQGNDLKTIEKPITTLLEKHKDKIELVLFGWSNKIAEQYGVLKGFKVTYEKPVPFQEYHARLNNLTLDIGLLPFVNNSFNVSGKGLTRFLDFSANMIPVVAPKMLPFEKVIRDGENGFIASNDDEWISKTEQVIVNAQLRKEIGNNAFKTAWESFGYTPKAIQRLRSIFI